MSQDAFARLMYAYMALHTAVSAWVAPGPVWAAMLAHDGAWGYAVVIGAAAVSVAIAVDVAINDWLPERYVCTWTRRRRHYLYAVTAACYITPLFAAGGYLRGAGQVIFYVGMALFGLVLGYRETRSKQEATCAG
jgi:hypothetical protein